MMSLLLIARLTVYYHMLILYHNLASLYCSTMSYSVTKANAGASTCCTITSAQHELFQSSSILQISQEIPVEFPMSSPTVKYS